MKLTVVHAQLHQVSQFEQYSLAVVDEQREGAELGVAGVGTHLLEHQVPNGVAVEDLDFVRCSRARFL